MAEAQLFVSQDEFTCSVCLDTLTDPVTIPCGHNFCLKCLTNYWDQSQECSCPQCRENFTTRPALRRNNLLNEVIKKLKKTTLSSPPPQNYAGPGDVECDFCTGKKFRAVKSCLTCPASYCQTHLQPHYEGDTLKHHKLVDPDRNLKEKLCEKHQKSLEIFCKTDDSCICLICVVTGHKNHEMVELEKEREGKQKQLGVTLSDIKRGLEERAKTLKETRRAMDKMNMSVVRELEENEKSFTALMRCIEEAHRKLTEKIREQEKREMEKAEGVMEQLEKEIEELKRREAELKELSESKDHLHFLQTFSSRCVLPVDGDSLSFTVTADFSSEDLRKELSGLTKSLEKISRCEIMTWTPSEYITFCWLESTLKVHIHPFSAVLPLGSRPSPVTHSQISSLVFFSLLSDFCPLTLDINTAHRDLRLSEGNKKVECSGNFMDIGVAYKGMSRKGGWECGLGNNDKSWSLLCSHSQYSVWHKHKETVISAPYSPRIGVYLDWPAGSLSFYSVSHTMTLLHRLNTSFTEPLYPGFSVGLHCSVTISHLTPCDH
ncbi:E3 ubiquitin/ISG15 ligase TRIM25-like [Erpetoichthys calabaricus]|uniref:E3 ubiquitin/ISG15 ligase TRIM25-like n=1 Tax=Erpetoichthys calabaricus TaxID=27687 RepID=UPI0022344A75|nr:E3 ubiquitin/ISG15 ligase TRIM25-like [Erpetoichthys calabaricus]